MYEDFFAERLTQLRSKKGISARDMSLSMGQSANYINMIENRNSNPSMSAFYIICEYLGITPKEFFDDGNTDPKQTAELSEEIKKLDGKSREYLLGLIREMNNRPK